jgi:hypothetical protein
MSRLGVLDVHAARLATCVDGCGAEIARPRSVSATGARGGEITGDALWPPNGADGRSFYFLSSPAPGPGRRTVALLVSWRSGWFFLAECSTVSESRLELNRLFDYQVPNSAFFFPFGLRPSLEGKANFGAPHWSCGEWQSAGLMAAGVCSACPAGSLYPKYKGGRAGRPGLGAVANGSRPVVSYRA